MNKLALTIAAVLLGTATLSAQAAEPNYTYVQASYNWSGISPDVLSDINLNAWNLAGSMEFADHFYGFVGYQDGTGDNWNSSMWNLGLGYKMKVAENTDWYIQGKYIDESLKYRPAGVTVINDSDSGFGFGTGVRSMVTDHIELQGGINYTMVNGLYGDGFGIAANGIYHFNDTWGVTLGYAYDWRQDFNISDINVGVRASF
jgi:opacity protein-like surface antigen